MQSCLLCDSEGFGVVEWMSSGAGISDERKPGSGTILTRSNPNIHRIQTEQTYRLPIHCL